ncbi:type 1 glutamine amidotransferase [Adhaeribacter swui]|uniref:Type 1 glutamine amidotransferase n=1 Tax=Adhaeribacter swui TaxID=2086471 RepID=A0A7G7GAC6_9BACT|nr:type 1 glutamine amidotransferase domain-containing protein [Adhaeribacter swui]QNF34110.1 type 1 glutamine amidotransferase [Adhaeribacter swui]
MSDKLEGKKVAILAEDGFEQSELEQPKKALEEAGATTHVISSKSGKIKAWDETDWGDKVAVDKTLDEVSVADYDALLLPGGVMNPDKLRANPTAVSFVKDFLTANKPVAAICHGPWTLIETGLISGKTLTSYESIKTDLKNAGVNWVDQEVVVDGNLVTSRKPDDIPAFNKQIIESFALVGAGA